MVRLYGSLVLFLCYFTVVGQVVFNQLPRDLQLYPRNETNQANVPVSGTVTAAGWTKVGVQLLREGVVSQAFSQTIAPAVAKTVFQFQGLIKAEPAEYTVRVFLYKNNDSTLVAVRNRIVCGDVYIIHGQSNAKALSGLDQFYSFNFDDKYLRNCTFPFNSPDIPADMRWYPAKDPYASVGGFGLTLQRLILQTYGIPTVMLNGAVGGTGIIELSTRDAANPANLGTYYGQLLFRARWAGVDKHVKAIIWKQGEDEAGNGPEGYAEKFSTLYSQLRQDYGNARIYVGQVNILADQQDGAAALRDFQRRTKYLYNNVESIATVGTPGYDGIHYSPEANQQLAREQFRQIARDVYGSKDTVQINSPDIKKVFYSPRKDSITLVFDNEMQMVFRDTAFYNFATEQKVGSRFLRHYFYLDKQAGLVSGVSTSGNRVTLSLQQPASARAIRYLPAYFSDQLSTFYDGPTLKNARGVRAFTFDNVPIADAIAPIMTLAARPLTETKIQLNWTPSATAQVQYIERADDTPTTFRRIGTLSGGRATYTDTLLTNPLGTYFYRLRAYSDVSESAYSNVVSARPLVLAVEPTEPVVRLYPNPLSADRVLYIQSDRVMFSIITVRDLLGRTIKRWTGSPRTTMTLTLDDVAAGLYIADLETATGQLLRRKVVVR
ncbi:sialate O-acetylesterase [Spirosoma utsteinense]|uniref:sialate O-acetylesterase n=1 Tax=Spirosoma utsteinense TaxID=2585773 RepID=UPI001648A4C3|nr:sialate O-acetylesterase [Spirosoma utsteinense]